MRFIRFISAWILLWTALFYGCSSRDTVFTEQNSPLHFNELRAVEALLETDPALALDSVDVLVEKSLTRACTALDHNELQLRFVQAQYKNHCLSEHSPDLSSVIAFYDSLALAYPSDADLQYLRANAYYYKGVECMFAKEEEKAFSHYLAALGVMQQREDWGFNPFAIRFIALIYTRLSETLYRHGIADAALQTCRAASTYYKSEADLSAMLRFEAAIQQSEKNYDKALALFEQAEQRVPVGDGPMQLVIGVRFYEQQQYDSAMVHLERAFDNGDRFARIDAASKLLEICRLKGLVDEELRYTRFYVENSLLETRMAARKMEIEYLYEDFNQPNFETVTNNNGPNFSVVLLLLLVLAIAFMAFIIVRNRKRITHIENKLSTIEQKHEQETADKDHEIEQMAQQLSDTRQQLNAHRVDFEDAWKAFCETPVVQKIKCSVEGKDIMIKSVGVYPKLKLKEMDYIDLVQAANRCFPNFSSRFLKDHPDLNVADLRHSCLGLLGMNDAEIAVLVGISYSGTNRRTNKILMSVNQGDNLEHAIINYIKTTM